MPSGIREWWLFLYLCLIPIGWSPWPAQIQWADVAFLGLAVSVWRARPPRRFAVHALDALILLYLAASLASFSKTPDLPRSGVEFVKQGSLVLVYGVFSMLASERGLAAKALEWSATVAVVLAGLSLAALATYAMGLPWLAPLLTIGVLPDVGEAVRIKGALLSPGFFCNYLTMALPVLVAAVFLLPRRTVRNGLRLVLVMAAAAGTATYSVVGFLWAGLAAAWRRWGSTRTLRLARAAAAAACVGLLVIGNLLFAYAIREVRWTADRNVDIPPSPSGYLFQEEGIGARRVTVSVSYDPVSYLRLKRVALRAFLREPLTGVGLGAFADETERAYREGALQQLYRRADPHCELLGRLAETGILGGATLLLLWWGIGRSGWLLLRRPQASAWMASAILAGCLGLLVNSVNADIMNFRFLWVGLGLLRGQLARAPS